MKTGVVECAIIDTFISTVGDARGETGVERVFQMLSEQILLYRQADPPPRLFAGESASAGCRHCYCPPVCHLEPLVCLKCMSPGARGDPVLATTFSRWFGRCSMLHARRLLHRLPHCMPHHRCPPMQQLTYVTGDFSSCFCGHVPTRRLPL